MAKLRNLENRPVVTTPGRELHDQELRAAATLVVQEQGWKYEYHGGGRKPRLYAPDGQWMTLPLTPSSHGSVISNLAQMRRLGADLDEEAALRRRRRSRTRTVLSDEGVVETPWTESEWRERQRQAGGWRAAYAPPLPEPEPKTVLSAYAERVKARLESPHVRSDATGNGQWSLAEARQMLKDGYSPTTVVTRTGWGMMWLQDLVDRLAVG